jgi:hypothetical protein
MGRRTEYNRMAGINAEATVIPLLLLKATKASEQQALALFVMNIWMIEAANDWFVPDRRKQRNTFVNRARLASYSSTEYE